MKRIVLGLAALVSLLVVLLLAAPLFIDINRHKDTVLSLIKDKTGYDVTVAGDMSLSLIPLPTAKIEGLTVSNPDFPGDEKKILSMREAKVSVSPLPLLTGRVVLTSIRLIDPVITLTVSADGRQSWATALADQAKAENAAQTSENPASFDSNAIAVQKLEIKNGSVVFDNRQTASRINLERIGADLSGESLYGPYIFKGEVDYNGLPVKIEAQSGRWGQDIETIALQLDATLPENGVMASYSGIISTGETLELQGETSLKFDNLAKTLAALGDKSTSPSLSKPVQWDGVLTYGDDRVAFKDTKLTLGASTFTGGVEIANLSGSDATGRTVSGSLTAKGPVALDEWMPAKQAEKAKAVTANEGKDSVLASARFLPDTLALPALNGRFTLTADQMTLKDKNVGGVTIALDFTPASVKAHTVLSNLPGRGSLDAVMSISGGTADARPAATLTGTARTERIGALLSAYPFIDPALAKQAELLWNQASFDVTGSVSGDTARLTQATVQLDGTTATLSGAYKKAARPALTVKAGLNALDIDALKTKLNANQPRKREEAKTGAAQTASIRETLKGLALPFDLDLEATVGALTLDKRELRDVAVKGTLKDKRLDLATARIGSVLGTSVGVSGGVADIDQLTGLNVSLSAKTADAEALMSALNVKLENFPRVGAADAALRLEGDAARLNVTADVNALRGAVNASGTLENMLDKPDIHAFKLRVRHPDAAQAIRIVQPSFKGGAGLDKPLDVYAEVLRKDNAYEVTGLKGNIGAMALAGAMKWVSNSDRPDLTGSLQLGDVPLDAFVSGGDSPSGPSSAPAAGTGGRGGDDVKWSRTAINTGWMRQLDFDVSLVARSVTHKKWRFDNPAIAATLENGKLTIGKMDAGLFGGKILTNATIASGATERDPINIAVNAQMQGVEMDNFVQALSGSPLIQADGKVSMDLGVTSAGISPAALMFGLKGNSTIKGETLTMYGFDLAQLAGSVAGADKPKDAFKGLFESALKGGQTRFDTLDGEFVINEGVANIDHFRMDGPSAIVTATGNVNLARWLAAVKTEISLKGRDDVPPFEISFNGPLDNPGKSFANNALKGFFDKQVGERLDKLLQDKLGDKLGKSPLGTILGVQPQQQPQPVPADQPATTPDQQQPTPSREEQILRGVLDQLRR